MYALVLSTSSNDDNRTAVSLINAQSRDAVPLSDRGFTLSSGRAASASDGDGGSAV